MAVAIKSANVKTAMTFIEAFNSRDFSNWYGILDSGFSADYPGGSSLAAEHARGFNESFLPAFPDLHFEVQSVLEEGDRVVMEWVASGTHDGPLMTPNGQTIPPTHRSGEVHGVLITTVRDGKIARERTYLDQLELLGQLGLLP